MEGDSYPQLTENYEHQRIGSENLVPRDCIQSQTQRSVTQITLLAGSIIAVLVMFWSVFFGDR